MDNKYEHDASSLMHSFVLNRVVSQFCFKYVSVAKITCERDTLCHQNFITFEQKVAWEWFKIKQRRTKEPLDESERGEWESWLKTQHSEN